MNQEIIPFIIVGFLAQLIDGSLGMAYGVSSNTFLLTLGMSPVLASASVHTAEVFTTLISGISHFSLGNVDRDLFKRLVIPGVIGGVIGAYILVNVPTDIIKPIVSIYLLLMGFRILYMAYRNVIVEKIATKVELLGLIGGFFDAIGGGGWGPIVTTTLIAEGSHPRKAIGSVNASEFFVTVVEAITFFLTLGTLQWNTVLGLFMGGVIAAPIGAFVTRRLPSRWMMVFVGVLISLLSIRTIVLSFGGG
jgi:uncharacterized protein